MFIKNSNCWIYVLQADRFQVIGQLKSIGEETKQFRLIMDEKRKEMEPLQQALGKLRSSNTGGRERSFICSSEEELNDVVSYSFNLFYVLEIRLLFCNVVSLCIMFPDVLVPQILCFS